MYTIQGHQLFGPDRRDNRIADGASRILCNAETGDIEASWLVIRNVSVRRDISFRQPLATYERDVRNGLDIAFAIDVNVYIRKKFAAQVVVSDLVC